MKSYRKIKFFSEFRYNEIVKQDKGKYVLVVNENAMSNEIYFNVEKIGRKYYITNNFTDIVCSAASLNDILNCKNILNYVY